MLSIDKKIAYLRKNVMFKDSPLNELESIAEIAQTMNFSDNQTIFNAGDTGDAIYFIANGQVRVHKDGQDITVLRVGECVGEMAVMDAGKRSASVSSLGDSLLLRLDRDNFHRVMQSDINLMRKILTIVVGKLRMQTDRDVVIKVQNARNDQDLERAKEMQVSILPDRDLNKKMPNGLGLFASGYCKPEAKVGGDYYDYFILPDDKLGIMIGDVKGHGFHAGLMVSMVKSCLHMQMKNDYSLASVMSAMNEIVHIYGFETPNHIFMTFCYMLFDLRNCTVSFCNAAHPYPRHYLAGENRIADIDLESGNGLLGFNETEEYYIFQELYGKDDLFILYSDGLTEAENNNQELFGEERLEGLIIQNAHLTPKEIKENILKTHKEFCGDVTQADDTTLVAIKIS